MEGSFTFIHGILERSHNNGCSEMHVDAIKKLLEHGASSRNKYGETPFISCVKSGLRCPACCSQAQWQCGRKEDSTIPVELCKWLNKLGADVDLTTNDNQTVFHVIVKEYQDEYQRDSVDEEYSYCDLASLQLARELSEYFCASEQASVLLNTRDQQNGNTPLHLLALKHPQTEKNSPLFESLVQNVKVVNTQNDKQQTPLHLAKSFQLARALLSSKARPNAVDEDGNTPLLLWVQRGQNHETCDLPHDVRVLLEDQTILHYNQWVEVLQQGMDPLAVNNAGDTVLSVLLSSRQFDNAKKFIKAVSVAKPDYINKQDDNGDTFLHIACRFESDRMQEIIKLLLELNANPNLGNRFCQTPLHICCEKLANIFSKLLLRKQYKEENVMKLASAKAIDQLRAYGADPNIPAGTGQTCLAFAEAKKMNRLQRLLHKPVDKRGCKFPLPWNTKQLGSEKHKHLLEKVHVGKESKTIDSFHFHCEKKIGCGTFGVVFAGINENDGREVAVKKIHITDSPYNAKTCSNEIMKLVKLQASDYVVRYINCCKGEDQEYRYIILELMEGDLSELHNPEPMLCRDVICGLAYLHSCGIIHCDLKPKNILYGKYPRQCLKLADFGFSKNISSGSSSLIDRECLGTRCWMAPEVLRGEKNSKESDMFSAGLVLHYILTKKTHPFSVTDQEIVETTVTNIFKKEIKPNIASSISPKARHLLTKMLSKNEEVCPTMEDTEIRPTAVQALNHPVFWSSEKERHFLCAVANKIEFTKWDPNNGLGKSSMENDLDKEFGDEFMQTSWSERKFIQDIFEEMGHSRKVPKDHTKSPMGLVRFIRNCYEHGTQKTRPEWLRKYLLKYFIFFEQFPSLLITLYKGAVQYRWIDYDDLKNVLQSEQVSFHSM